MLPAPLWLALVRAMLVVDDGTRITQLSLYGEGKEEAASPPQKEANPASLRSAAPSKGRGSRGYSLLPMEGGAPKGRRLDGGYRYPRNKDFPDGEGAIRGCRFSRIVNANTGYVEKNNIDGQSLPRVGKVASGASRIGF